LFRAWSVWRWFRGRMVARNSKAVSANGAFESAIVYEIDDAAQAVDVTRIAHRREVYE